MRFLLKANFFPPSTISRNFLSLSFLFADDRLLLAFLGIPAGRSKRWEGVEWGGEETGVEGTGGEREENGMEGKKEGKL